MAKKPKQLDAYAHDGGRKNIPTAELQSLAEMAEEANPVAPVSYPRNTPLVEGETRERNQDLDPQLIWKGAKIRITEAQQKQLAETGELTLGDAQLVWTGKDTQDWSDLVVNVPPIYVQEKIHPRVLIDELKRMSEKDEALGAPMVDLFADFNGIDLEARTEFYAHDVHWTNRMILGDSLQVMASLAEREALRGKVQCIYFDPPYGIKFNSNWQVSTRNRDVKDGKLESLTREPEQVKAFRDTWKDGIHSYLTYLRDRMTAARDLLTESGSVFVQISDENVHRVRALMDEVFGEENYLNTIYFSTTGGLATNTLSRIGDQIVWYSKDARTVKYRPTYEDKKSYTAGNSAYKSLELEPYIRRSMVKGERAGKVELPKDSRPFTTGDLCGQNPPSAPTPFEFQGQTFNPTKNSHWKPNYPAGMNRLKMANRIELVGKTIRYVRYFDDKIITPFTNVWTDTGHAGFASNKMYVVETNDKVVERCMLMATDPGDIVFDPNAVQEQPQPWPSIGAANG